MFFTFKSKPSHFIVHEILGYTLSGQGDFLYIYFEKEALNTMDLVKKWSQARGVERKVLGISGIKDRNAITRQRMSIPRILVQQQGGVSQLQDFLEQDVIVVKHTRHDQHLQIGRHAANRFVITLPAKKSLSTDLKQQIQQQRNQILTHGFPNCFGIQRFGPGNKNYHQAVSLLEQAETIPDSQYVLRFIIQAYPSMLFNHYAMQRRQAKYQPGLSPHTLSLDGDILVTDTTPRREHYYFSHQGFTKEFDYHGIKKNSSKDSLIIPTIALPLFGRADGSDLTSRIIANTIPTGPLFGMQTILPPEGSASYQEEYALYQSSMMEKGKKLIQRLHLYGGRRPLVAFLADASLTWQDEDILLSFTLPTGSYATVMLAHLFGDVDRQTCEQNRRIIPNKDGQEER